MNPSGEMAFVSDDIDYSALSRQSSSQTSMGLLAGCGVVAFVCLVTLVSTRFADQGAPGSVAALAPAAPVAESAPVLALAPPPVVAQKAADPIAAVVEANKPFGDLKPRTRVAAVPPAPETAPVAAPPLPPRRATDATTAVPLPPANPFRGRSAEQTTTVARPEISRPVRPGQTSRRAAVAPTPAEEPNIFQRIFGALNQPAPAQSRGPALAYAGPDAASLGGGLPRNKLAPEPPQPAQPPATAGGGTAIYDITARTVYLPSGKRLEAHSGLGPRMDDPRQVHVRNQGATPPKTYNLSFREELFHGVRAIRMTPSDGIKPYGRDGLLVHSYLLGPNGDSNGCVSVRDYPEFLAAFQRGEFNKLVVVARQGDFPAASTKQASLLND